MPWVTIVDSRATIGFFPARAPATSRDSSKRSAALITVLLLRGQTRLSGPDYRQSPATINGGAFRRRRRLVDALARPLGPLCWRAAVLDARGGGLAPHQD